MNHNPDTYYNRPEVSNSDLTALKQLLHPHPTGDKERAFHIGNLIDALITEPARVDYYRYTVDDVQYTAEDFHFGEELHRALRLEAKKDRFLENVLKMADTQRVSIRHGQEFQYGDFPFTLDTRCKWDWFLPGLHFGGDLKTTSTCSQKEFEEAYDFFDIDRSRAWYMDIEGTDKDFVYAISKRTMQIYKVFITRGDKLYKRGREKYEELAFQYWCLNL